MKRYHLIALVVLFSVASGVTSAADKSRPPNIVLILMDDMGWRDVGFMGNKFVETPHIDALAKRGVVFTQSYSSAPNCAPTRRVSCRGNSRRDMASIPWSIPGNPPVRRGTK